MSVALELATDAKHPDDVLKGEIVGAQMMQVRTLAEYMHQAEICRARESGAMPESESPVEKSASLDGIDEEMINARRALRTASWAAVFYLITTDILGPSNAGYAFISFSAAFACDEVVLIFPLYSQVGYVPGAILYVVMGFVACYTGLILWRLFCALDSDRYPIKTYSDLCERIFGAWFKNLSAVLQSLQLIINVGTICLSNAQSLEEIANNHKICFSVAILIWALVGMVIGQIRTLKAYGWLANSAVWMNLLTIFLSMGFVAHSPPNFTAAKAAYNFGPGPIHTAKFVSLPLFSKVNGIMNMVFAYGGAMIFPEFMAEMKRPMDFWKAMCCAQLLIGIVYMMYGIFVYAFQGQFTLGIAYQGVSRFSWQTVCNVFGLLTGIIAAGLYGNIGIKVAYYHIVEQWLKGPQLMSRKGRVVWTFMVFSYWALAFIVGSAIPQVQTISGLVAAICIMQFTYSFPPLLIAGYYLQLDAAENDIGDTWYSVSRWKRALFGVRAKWYYKVFNMFLFLASLSMACLGMYGSGKAIQETFKAGGAATSFGCGAPV